MLDSSNTEGTQQACGILLFVTWSTPGNNLGKMKEKKSEQGTHPR